MDKKDLESKRLPDLKVIAKSIGLKGFETLKKADLVSAILEGSTSEPSVKSSEKKEEAEKPAEKPKRTRTIKKVIVAEETPKETLEVKKTEKAEPSKPEEINEVKPSEIDSKTEKPAFVKRTKPNPHPSKLAKTKERTSKEPVIEQVNRQINKPIPNQKQNPNAKKDHQNKPNKRGACRERPPVCETGSN